MPGSHGILHVVANHLGSLEDRVNPGSFPIHHVCANLISGGGHFAQSPAIDHDLSATGNVGDAGRALGRHR
jgi:hypothetical protein